MRSAESIGTVRTRRLHYLWFCHLMKWDDDLTLEGGTPEVALRGQFQFAMYALHLSSGHSIYCRSIKSATIEQYVLAAASFIQLFSGVDFRKDLPTDKHMGHILAPVLRDLKKYDLVPNRREPYDPKMHALAKQLAAQFPVNSLVASLTDSSEIGYIGGCRLGELAQPGTKSNFLKPQLNHLVGSPLRTRAFVPVDFRFVTVTSARGTGLDMVLHPVTAIDRVWVKYRTQKNGQHGEEKLYVLNPDPTGFCMVRSVYSALERFQRLVALEPRMDPSVTPLTVYWDPRSATVKLITGNAIETFIRRLASAVYKLDPVTHAEELQRWSSHSYRVGACVALHAMGFSTLDIQWLLRWRSTAFMVYLRNIAILSVRQYRALDRSKALPFL